MSELSLIACPICYAQNSLSRETMERAGRPFTWYECQECGSVLLWMGDDQWAYQKVGREDKAYLLKQPQSTEQLQTLLPKAEDALHSRGLGKVSSSFVTLSCPSCGGQLEITSDVDRFACSYCGTEQIVRRSGGVVSLAPVVEEIKHVGIGVDKTAAELAIKRLADEIAVLERDRKEARKAPSGYEAAACGPTMLMGALALIIPTIAIVVATQDGGKQATLVIGVGVLVFLIVVGAISLYWRKARKRADEERAAKVTAITREIEGRTAELEKNRKLVSE